MNGERIYRYGCEESKVVFMVVEVIEFVFLVRERERREKERRVWLLWFLGRLKDLRFNFKIVVKMNYFRGIEMKNEGKIRVLVWRMKEEREENG